MRNCSQNVAFKLNLRPYMLDNVMRRCLVHTFDAWAEYAPQAVADRTALKKAGPHLYTSPPLFSSTLVDLGSWGFVTETIRGRVSGRVTPETTDSSHKRCSG